MNRLLPSLALALVLLPAPAVRGQSLTMGDYHERRQMLEKAYIAAGSAEEKERIWQRFRELELAYTAPEEAVASPPETPASAAAEVVVAALTRAFEAVAGGFGGPGGGHSGLGTTAANAPPTKAERIAELVARSVAERALKADLLAVGYEIVDDIGEYNAYHEEVGLWLDYESKSTADEFTERYLEDWAAALNDLGTKRKRIAGRRASAYWQEEVRSETRTLGGLDRRLGRQKESLSRVLTAFQAASDMEEGVAQVVLLRDTVTSIQNLLVFTGNPSAVSAVVAGALELANRTDPIGGGINSLVASIGRHLRRQAAQLEGYESLRELVDSIGQTVGAIQKSAGDLSWYAQRYRLAVDLEARPIYRRSW